MLSTFKHGHFCFMFELKFISIQFWKLFIFNKSCFHCALRWQSMCKASMSLKTDLISIQLLMCLNGKLWSIIYFPMERQINKKTLISENLLWIPSAVLISSVLLSVCTLALIRTKHHRRSTLSNTNCKFETNRFQANLKKSKSENRVFC